MSAPAERADRNTATGKSPAACAMEIKGLPPNVVAAAPIWPTILGVLSLILVHHCGRDAVRHERACVTLRQRVSNVNSALISTPWPSAERAEDGNQQKPAAEWAFVTSPGYSVASMA